MKLDSVLFDCWDTLITYRENGGDFFEPFYRHLIDNKGLSIEDIKKVRKLILDDYFRCDQYELKFDVVFKMALRLLGLKIDLKDSELEDIWCQNYSPTPRPNIMVLLDHLKKEGVKMAILSNTILSNKVTRYFIEKTLNIKLEDYFEFLLVSSEAGPKKPNPFFFKMGLAALGLEDGGRTLYIGDSPKADVYGAALAGLRPCFYAWRMKNSSHLEMVQDLFRFNDYLELVEFIKDNESYDVRLNDQERHRIDNLRKGVINEW